MEPLSTVTNAHHIFTQQSLLIFDFFEKRLERIALVEYAELQKSGATLKRRCWPSMLRACNLALAPRCDPALDANPLFRQSVGPTCDITGCIASRAALPSIASGQRPLAPSLPARAEFDC